MEVCELDSELVEVAEKWFGFERDASRMTLHIGDGIEFVKRCAADEKKRGWMIIEFLWSTPIVVLCVCLYHHELCTHTHILKTQMSYSSTDRYVCVHMCIPTSIVLQLSY